jgi:hypothetical protein
VTTERPERRKRGRPRAAEPGSTLSIWIPTRDHDAYAKLAATRGESISRTVGLLLKTKFLQDKP